MKALIVKMEGLVLHSPRQTLGLPDPVLDHAEAWQPTHKVLGLIDIDERGVEVNRVPLGKLRDRIDARLFQLRKILHQAAGRPRDVRRAWSEASPASGCGAWRLHIEQAR